MTTSKLTYSEPRTVSAAPNFEVDSMGLSKLRSIAQVQRLRRRQRLALFAPDSVYLVRTGLMAVEGAPVANSRSIMELLYPGDLVVPGVQAPIPDLGLTATTPAEVWRISAQTFMQELQRDGRLSDLIFHRLNSQRARMQLHVAILAGLASEQRVAALLIEAANRLGIRDARGTSFDMPLSRMEVAEYLALNADTLSRIMSRLTHASIIERSGRAQMTVRDWDGLLALCPIADAVTALHARPR